MQEIFGSVRRSLVFRPMNNDDGGFGGWVDKIRKSRVGLFSSKHPPSSPAALPPIPAKDNAPPIRWRKGELIGCGAFGRVYMGMNLDSGELLAVKQVLIAANSASKEKAQTHIRELEEEVKLLKNLSHQNIVRYVGTAREDDSLNIFLEFVSGGSISSLLGKFGSFPEAVIRTYTKQLLLGLEYLHKNGIMHRDIKGANILVDNKGCIKLADFGASKKVVELATISGAKSMKGTPYWMAPEVILQTGHSFSADIWSVGCTVIEMATGKPPWSQQYQEVAALFHIGTTKAHPPIPEHLSAEAKDFLLKCLQKEPHLRPSASELLQHPFVAGDNHDSHPSVRTSLMENSGNLSMTPEMGLKCFVSPVICNTTCSGLKDVCNTGSMRCSTIFPEKLAGAGSLWEPSNCDDDMCQIDDKDDFVSTSTQLDSTLLASNFNKSFNPMCEPDDDWPSKFGETPKLEKSEMHFSSGQRDMMQERPSVAEDDDEVTESKIRAFLDEKALDLKKLQEELCNTLNVTSSPVAAGNFHNENISSIANLPPKSKSPNRVPSRRFSMAVDASRTASPASHNKRASNVGGVAQEILSEIQPPPLGELKELFDDQKEQTCPRANAPGRCRREDIIPKRPYVSSTKREVTICITWQMN
ncbi:Protein kinase domain, partial [Dillenia turbinata]